MDSGLRARLSNDWRDLPSAFWFLWVGTIVNRLGGFAVPFLMLYLTARLGMGAGAAARHRLRARPGVVPRAAAGGELADRLGRRPVMLLSFFVSPLAMLVWA